MAEIESIETHVRHFLFPTEEAKAVAECVIMHSPQLLDQETKPVLIEERIKRILAVISHPPGNSTHQLVHERGWCEISRHIRIPFGTLPSRKLMVFYQSLHL